MESTSQKQTPNDKKNAGHSLKKKLAIATMAASLGVSLGVPVADVMAADANLQNPPGVTLQGQQNVASEQLKIKSSVQGKVESVQGKFRSTQGKIESTQSKVESTQLKINAQ